MSRLCSLPEKRRETKKKKKKKTTTKRKSARENLGSDGNIVGITGRKAGQNATACVTEGREIQKCNERKKEMRKHRSTMDRMKCDEEGREIQKRNVGKRDKETQISD